LGISLQHLTCPAFSTKTTPSTSGASSVASTSASTGGQSKSTTSYNCVALLMNSRALSEPVDSSTGSRWSARLPHGQVRARWSLVHRPPTKDRRGRSRSEGRKSDEASAGANLHPPAIPSCRPLRTSPPSSRRRCSCLPVVLYSSPECFSETLRSSASGWPATLERIPQAETSHLSSRVGKSPCIERSVSP
jgi:hypothetical protein